MIENPPFSHAGSCSYMMNAFILTIRLAEYEGDQLRLRAETGVLGVFVFAVLTASSPCVLLAALLCTTPTYSLLLVIVGLICSCFF